MRDSNQEYPVRPPQKGEHHPFDDDANADALHDQPPPHRGPLHQRDQAMQPRLPRGGFGKAMVIALAAGILAALLNIIFTLANASLYQQAAGYAGHPTQMPLNIATTIFGLFCLTSFIGLVIYFIAGFITGKVAVERRLGFFCGFVAGAIAQIIGFVIGQLPNYPGKISTGFSGNPINIGGGIITALILLLLVALLGGLLGFLGARLGTRRHPYYVGYDA
ncbi:MAG TPA: hypothetical protein VNE38_01980 [Ktedonobacteraceae bacterium]|nr:hypothetical protein [Ktedonobacteraceae bacterium]